MVPNLFGTSNLDRALLLQDRGFPGKLKSLLLQVVKFSSVLRETHPFLVTSIKSQELCF